MTELYRPPGHGSSADAPAGQYLLAVQLKHAVWPVPPWKVPALHRPHADWLASGCTVPAPHGVWLRTPVVQDEPAGHELHWSLDARPTSLLYEPAGHGSAATDPSVQ